MWQYSNRVMNEKRESSATIDRKKSIRNAVRIVTIGKNGVAYNNSDVAGGRISPIFLKTKHIVAKDVVGLRVGDDDSLTKIKTY